MVSKTKKAKTVKKMSTQEKINKTKSPTVQNKHNTKFIKILIWIIITFIILGVVFFVMGHLTTLLMGLLFLPFITMFLIVPILIIYFLLFKKQKIATNNKNNIHQIEKSTITNNSVLDTIQLLKKAITNLMETEAVGVVFENKKLNSIKKTNDIVSAEQSYKVATLLDQLDKELEELSKYSKNIHDKKNTLKEKTNLFKTTKLYDSLSDFKLIKNKLSNNKQTLLNEIELTTILNDINKLEQNIKEINYI